MDGIIQMLGSDFANLTEESLDHCISNVSVVTSQLGHWINQMPNVLQFYAGNNLAARHLDYAVDLCLRSFFNDKSCKNKMVLSYKSPPRRFAFRSSDPSKSSVTSPN